MSDTHGWNDLAGIEVITATKVKHTTGNNLLIIDGNNLSYRWLQRPNYNSFENDYIKTVNSLAESYSASRIICCFDYGRSAYRNAKTDGYKATRKKPETEEEQKKYDEFFSCLNRVTDSLEVEKYKFYGLESDDSITYFVNNLNNKFDHTWIISSDRDLYQLLDNHISIFSIFSKKEITLESLNEKYEATPEIYMLARIIEGDKSDNIIGISGIGEKRSLDLAKTYKTLPNLINHLPLKGTAQYIKNLNAGKDTLLKNYELINLKRFNKEAILACQNGEKILETLEASL